GEMGKELQEFFPGEKLEGIYGADAAGPGFIGRSRSHRLDPGDATWVEDIHTTFLFGDPLPIGTKDIYVIGQSCNPISAHSQSWDILMQSLTDLSMRTLLGDGVGLYSIIPGIDFYVLPEPPDPVEDWLFCRIVPDGKKAGGGDSAVVSSFDPNDKIGSG